MRVRRFIVGPASLLNVLGGGANPTTMLLTTAWNWGKTMDYANPVALRLRRFGQRLGILRPVLRAFRRLTNASYEEAFDAMLVAEVRPGDTVWDIGANAGIYTAKFSRSAGPTGRVVAFEPSPGAIADLRAATEDLSNVMIETTALADAPGDLTFYTNIGSSSVTDGLRRASETDEAHTVRVERGDHFLGDGAPNVIKIDVEGFEREVLLGLHQTLRHDALRAVFVEVHFLESAKRGFPEAPTEITGMLKAAGLDLIWTDPSHLVGRRRI